MKRIYFLSFLILIGCSTFGYNPKQEIALAEAAIAAAKEVHAERLASDKYQFAVEWLGKARGYEKKGKAWSAKRAANKSRFFAEEAEEIAIMKLSQVPHDTNPDDLERLE